MRTDVKGCSTCQVGRESYETFRTTKGERIQYDYRTQDGDLFSCIAKSLEEARKRRDDWLADN